jgi:hypothetical protein
LLFATAMGFTPAIEEGIKVVDLPATEELWDALSEAAGERHHGYRIVTWRDRVPDEQVDGYCRLNEMFLHEAPMGELEVENERWTRRGCGCAKPATYGRDVT